MKSRTSARLPLDFVPWADPSELTLVLTLEPLQGSVTTTVNTCTMSHTCATQRTHNTVHVPCTQNTDPSHTHALIHTPPMHNIHGQCMHPPNTHIYIQSTHMHTAPHIHTQCMDAHSHMHKMSRACTYIPYKQYTHTQYRKHTHTQGLHAHAHTNTMRTHTPRFPALTVAP